MAGLAFSVDLRIGTTEIFHDLGNLLVELDLLEISVVGAAILIAVAFHIMPDILSGLLAFEM